MLRHVTRHVFGTYLARVQVLEEVNMNTKALLVLDDLLLKRLTENTSTLLDDREMITVLANTKAKAIEVKEKLAKAAETRRSINDKREQYRPVATRGSVLYFAIMDMAMVNWMYQTSLSQVCVCCGVSWSPWVMLRCGSCCGVGHAHRSPRFAA
jgi:hypothetical protein